MDDEGKKRRCRWCNERNPLYVAYHDCEWGVPVHDDGKLFEMLLLECFQAGLSWECVLNKRDAFRRAFDGFCFRTIAGYGEAEIEALRNDSGIIRNRLKIRAAVGNARVFMRIRQEFGTFDRYVWGFTGGKTVRECDKTRSSLSDAVSEDLRRRGMKFVGTTVVYAYLQAVGVIDSHEGQCFLYGRSDTDEDCLEAS